ncbi:RHS repeat-associated core domain-containing protein [Pseudomonas sp. NBRC 111123]|jgi:RHS repeat-associated protein|uniref:RHS repeat-associated core domain-containing protein n=1 Tax=Pseudomonas sp. NBRC 111123 TaxID=1661038 RepID=UPI0009EB7840|nr:RHS repeat-associated core domain-containing protein [Pseudomonas sp. NBRC 111123]
MESKHFTGLSNSAWQARATAFSVYGYAEPVTQHMLAFTGEHLNAANGGYMLGQGYRSYSPALMRFRSADSWSPFGQGGVNAYAYCGNDPINHTDPTGHRVAQRFRRLSLPRSLQQQTPATQAIHALDAQVQEMTLRPTSPPTGTTNTRTQQQPENLVAARPQADVPRTATHTAAPNQGTPNAPIETLMNTPPTTTQRVNAVLARRQARSANLRAALEHTASPASRMADTRRQ